MIFGLTVWQLVLYIVCSLMSAFLRAFRIILINGDNKFVGSFANSMTFAFAALVTKFVCKCSWGAAFCVELVSNFLACWIAMWLGKKINKDKEKEK